MVLVVHPSPSVVRAAVMGLVALLGVLLGRPHRAPAALAATVVVLLVADPWLAGEVGFVLSVLATGALVLLGGPLADRWSRGRSAARSPPRWRCPSPHSWCARPVILLLTPRCRSTPSRRTSWSPRPSPPRPCSVWRRAAWRRGGPPAPRCSRSVRGAACWWIGAVGRLAAAAPGAQVAWLPGWTGAAVLAVAGACALRLLVGGRAAPAGERR